jgi:hypothetical protein
MRQIISITALALVLCGSAAAAWKEYPLPQFGFAVEFPAAPTMSTGNYRTVMIRSAPVHIYSVKEDRSVYVASVVDLIDRKEEGASILGEAEFNLSMMGDVSNVSVSRVEPGANAVWGHFVTVDCRKAKISDQPGQGDAARAWFKNNTGLECADGTRLTVNMFFHRGRLYLIHGINLPSPGETSIGPSALRFANSISFFSADGTLQR